MLREMMKTTLFKVAFGLAVLILIVLVIVGCGESQEDKEAKVRREHPAFQAHNYIERQIFNHRLEISDDPSTILFCTTLAFDRPPKVDIIAGKLVSGSKRPDPLYTYDNGYTIENQDAQGMHGQSVPYRFGFTPAGQYVDFTDLPTECTTEAQSTKKTNIGEVVVNNAELSNAASEAQQVLRSGSVTRNGQFQGFTPAAKRQAQAIMDNAVARSK